MRTESEAQCTNVWVAFCVFAQGIGHISGIYQCRLNCGLLHFYIFLLCVDMYIIHIINTSMRAVTLLVCYIHVCVYVQDVRMLCSVYSLFRKSLLYM